MLSFFKKMHEESSEISKLDINIKQAIKLLNGAEKHIATFNGDHTAYIQLKNETQTLAYFIQIAVLDRFEDLHLKASNDDVGALQSKVQVYKVSTDEIKSRIENIARQVGVEMELKSIFQKDDYFYYIESKTSAKAYKNWGFV
jgi:hypothetical protein